MTGKKLGEMAKFLVALATAAVLAAETFTAPASTGGHVLLVATAVLGAIAVYGVENKDPNK